MTREGVAPLDVRHPRQSVPCAIWKIPASNIKEVRTITGLVLKDAKDMVEGAPKTVKEGASKEDAETVKEGASKEDAEKIKAQLEKVGVKVTIK